MLPRAVPAVSPANVGRWHAAGGKRSGSLRKLLLRRKQRFSLQSVAGVKKIAVFWMILVLKLSHASGGGKAVPPRAQKNAVGAAPGRGFSSGC